MKNYPKPFLLEDHHQAYYVWKENKERALPLVHIDTHLDFNIVTFERQGMNIGNFIYPTLKEGIASELYWVIPGLTKEFSQNSKNLKNIFAKINQNEQIIVEIKREDKRITAKILGKNLTICTLEQLPKFTKPVLVDIDIDFFISKSLKEASNTMRIGKRYPWISISSFVSLLKKKIQIAKIITAAYSVNGGWTPMTYKTLGDELVKKLGFNNDEIEIRILAGKIFKKFRWLFDQGKLEKAKKYYQSLLSFNPAYYNFDNNYGRLYLLSGNYKMAEEEFGNMLTIDRNNIFAQFGLGLTYLFQKRLTDAKHVFQRLIELKNGENKNDLIIYLAYIEFRLTHLKKTRQLLKQIKQINTFILPFWLRCMPSFKKMEITFFHHLVKNYEQVNCL